MHLCMDVTPAHAHQHKHTASSRSVCTAVYSLLLMCTDMHDISFLLPVATDVYRFLPTRVWNISLLLWQLMCAASSSYYSSSLQSTCSPGESTSEGQGSLGEASPGYLMTRSGTYLGWLLTAQSTNTCQGVRVRIQRLCVFKREMDG